jgi:hypothetical protein
MIVWRGWGILTIAIAIAALAAVELTPGRSDAQFVAALAVAGVVNLWLGRRLNTGPARVLIDAAAARRIVARPRHDLLFVPMEYWSAAFAVGAAAIASA